MKPIIPKIRKLKLNFFDIVLILTLGVLLSVFLYLRISKKTEWITVRITVANDEWWWEGQPPQYWYVDDLQSGQAAYNTFGDKIAEITNVESFDIGGYRKRAYVDARLKGSYDNQRKIYLYNFQPLQIGKPIDLTFGKNNVKGLITYIDNSEITYVDKKIEVKLIKIEPWIAASYVKGLQMKDSQNRILASIDSVSVEPAKRYEFSDIRGQVIEVADPNMKDVTMTLTIKTFESRSTLHFVDRAAVKIGEKVWFQFPQAVIRDAEITKIFE